MNKFLLFIIIIPLFSCGKQTKDSNNNAEQQVTKEDTTIKVELKRFDSISFDPKIARKLSNKEILSTFTKRTKRRFDIEDPIYQAYSYKDQSGEYYLLLSERFKETDEKNDTLYDQIKALNLSYRDKQFKKKSSIKDDIDKDWETSIGFWNKYSSLSDIDNDGLADLILVYGTMGQDGYTDGRVKIIIYHNKRRITIRHQNSDYDGRLTKISKKFYALPLQIQQNVKEKMRLMMKNKHAIFFKDWEAKMETNAISIDGL
ncbi:hypothetical protein ATE84_2168 [Aquimarina sp. MAR_2010_214]|uniref:M949_RS01915 family surface polysaccharide biosynthesis protein n=1 Tax=Aquimarina sp. MAR_2010_214 TaxID=1250026 RepID=UPI000C703E1A|nr:FG-GAP repeat protein [Aquimarina sp. MAR_2010_214]PKV50118.1 hypothetical protein ATE84_2168 [Aquimarina sp. MAR_2010_214]